MEHRQFTRVDRDITVILCTPQSTITGRVQNLSLYSLFVQTHSPLPPHTVVNVKVSLKSEEAEMAMRFTGKVVRSEANGVAIQITDMGIESFLHWKTLVSFAMGDSDQLEEEFAEYIRHRSEAQMT